MSSPPFFKEEWPSLNLQEKYNLLEKAFEGSKTNVPMPKNPKEHRTRILEACKIAFRHGEAIANAETGKYPRTPQIQLQKIKLYDKG